MRTCKLLSVIAVVCILVTALSVPVFAETEPANDWASDVLDTIQNYENGDVNIVYTSDSVVMSGIAWDVEVDALTEQVFLTLDIDLPAGYVVYDDPETAHIDGIRVNGATVTSYKIAIDITQDIDYTVDVRTVYAEGFLGTLAQISDGNYNWWKLLENPVGLLMALYYILATVSVLVGLLALIFNKNKRAKTSTEISQSVTQAAHDAAVATIETQVVPAVTVVQDIAQALVKAFVLSTSKSKEAPSALLDILQNVSNMDVAGAIEQAKLLIEKDKSEAEAALQATLTKLKDIANTSQEVLSNETDRPETPEEDVAIF